MQQEIIIATISIVITILIASHLLTSNANAHGVTGKTVVLYDNPEGNSRGWNPDHVHGSHTGTTQFVIFDPDYSPFTSTVLVNVINTGPALEACMAGSYFYPTHPPPAGIFQLHCGTAYDEGAALHYTLFNPICLSPHECLDYEVDPTVIEQDLKSSKNITQSIEGALSAEQQLQLANVTGAEGR